MQRVSSESETPQVVTVLIANLPKNVGQILSVVNPNIEHGCTGYLSTPIGQGILE